MFFARVHGIRYHCCVFQINRLEGQVSRYKASADNSEKIEDELKAEKRKLQREVKTQYTCNVDMKLQVTTGIDVLVAVVSAAHSCCSHTTTIGKMSFVKRNSAGIY